VLFGLAADGAACEKNRLEEKQRAARKQHGGDSSWKPRFERHMSTYWYSTEAQ